MSPSRRPSLRLVRSGDACIALLLVPAVVPAAASADYTSANQWAGGSLKPDRQRGASQYPAEGVLVSMTTSPTRARLAIVLNDSHCKAGRAMSGTVTPGAGGDAEHLVLGVEAVRKVRNRRVRLDYAVSLRSVAPGVLAGTASVRGTIRDGRSTARCRQSASVVLRSRSALNAPLQPLSTDPASTRVGILGATIAPRVKAAFAIAKRADGYHHAMWTMHLSCVQGSRRFSFDTPNFAPRFRIRADGSFRGREVRRGSGKNEDGRFTRTFVGTISGRIDPDGIARGTVSVRERSRVDGDPVRVCTLPRTSFAAAP